jgi:hypothetical protein
MPDEHFERLLKGYRLPEVSPELDRRVLRAVAAVMAREHARATMEHIGRSALEQLGFGHVAWLVDLVTNNDAEYSVDVL